jgi:hypothetical protein
MKNLHPPEHPDSLSVVVRMEIESLYVGRPPGVVNVSRYEYPDGQPDAQQFSAAVVRVEGLPWEQM